MVNEIIKVVALDLYGTFLASDDHYDNEEYACPPRKGFSDLIAKCKNKNIAIVTASDAGITNQKTDIKAARVNLSIFDKFYELKTRPKDFSKILKDYNIHPQELLVIGDRRDNDILGAKKINARYIWVPEYRVRENEFNLADIDF